jgi:hypothetical protein
MKSSMLRGPELADEMKFVGEPGLGRLIKQEKNNKAWSYYCSRAHVSEFKKSLMRIGGVDGALPVPYNYHPLRGYAGTYENVDAKVAFARAQIGWLRAAEKLVEEMSNARYYLEKFCNRGINGGGGANSPYSCLTTFPVGVWSPGALVRRMKKIRAKARVLMATSVTVKDPSWAAVAVAAAGKLPVNKAAVTAWAMTLACPRLMDDALYLRNYTAAREWLSKHLTTTSRQVRVTEGVEEVPVSMTVVHGIKIETVFLPKTWGRAFSYVITIGAFAYHCDCSYNEKDAVKKAMEAFKKAQNASREIVSDLPKSIQKLFLNGDLEILVSRKDSYDAGNCVAGTTAFEASNGWTNLQWIGASILLASGNSRAVNAAQVAIRKFASSL